MLICDSRWRPLAAVISSFSFKFIYWDPNDLNRKQNSIHVWITQFCFNFCLGRGRAILQLHDNSCIRYINRIKFTWTKGTNAQIDFFSIMITINVGNVNVQLIETREHHSCGVVTLLKHLDRQFDVLSTHIIMGCKLIPLTNRDYIK